MAETFEAYRTRVLSYLGDEEPIGVQQATPSQLDRRLRDVAPEELIRRPAPEKWSIAEIVAHLADAELAMGWRLRNMLANPGVALTWWDEAAGDGRGTKHDHPLCAVARSRASVGSSGCDLWQWGVSAMVAGSRHHALHAHARQCSEKEQPRLWPGAVYLCTGEQQLPLSCRRATELCRLKRSQSCPCLYRQRQTLRSMLPKSAMHNWTI